MTLYHGGKKIIGKELAKVIYDVSEEKKFEIKGYCEPFCGMLGVYQHIPELFGDISYKAGDINKSVIMMWQEAQGGWKPPVECSEEKYNELRYYDKKDSAEKGFIGHQYSFGGIYLKGYRGKYGGKDSYPNTSKNVINVANILSNVQFSHGEYKQFSDLKGYVIYCDPPYSSTACHYSNKFNSEEFWKWCANMSKYNLVFISEYFCPQDLDLNVVFMKKTKVRGNNGKSNKNVVVREEKLFIFCS